MIDEVITRITNTDLSNDPFEHKFIKEIFPKNFYEKLIENLPNKKDYTPINQTGTVSKNYPPERFVFNLNLENINKLENSKKEPLMELIKIFASPIFFKTVTNEFKNIIDKRIKNFTDYEINLLGKDKFKFYIQALLIKDFKKYQLGVHTDTTKKFLSFLFYLPKDENLIDLGTALYKLKKEIANIDEKGNIHLPPDSTDEYFVLVKKIPFLPNSLFVFPRTNYSFHGVEKINTDQSERNLIVLNYFFKTKE